MNKHILVVDDDRLITMTLKTLIKTTLKHKVTTFNNPENAVEFIKENKDVDLIISDFMMPEMNGLEFLREAKKEMPNTIRMLLTGYADKENAIKSINEVGLYYYMEKPWENDEMKRIIENGLEKKDLESNLKEKHFELKRLYEILQKDYSKTQEGMKSVMVSLANLLEARDPYTDGHTRRVSQLAEKLARNLGFEEESVDRIELGGILHDIGKVAVKDNILNKKGKLTDDEYDQMKLHTVLGEKICRPVPMLKECLDMIKHHHEKLNGKGYPDGLKGEEISKEVRILAAADIFDALFTTRPYKKIFPIKAVKEILTEEVEKNALDKTVVKELIKIIDSGEIYEIYERQKVTS